MVKVSGGLLGSQAEQALARDVGTGELRGEILLEVIEQAPCRVRDFLAERIEGEQPFADQATDPGDPLIESQADEPPRSRLR